MARIHVLLVNHAHLSRGHRVTSLRMSNNPDGLVQLFKILLLFLSQLLTSCCKRFIHPLCTGETNNGTRNTLVDPCERNMAHLPIVLLRDLFDTADDLLVTLIVTRCLVASFLFTF